MQKRHSSHHQSATDMSTISDHIVLLRYGAMFGVCPFGRFCHEDFTMALTSYLHKAVAKRFA